MANKRLIDADELLSVIHQYDEKQKSDAWLTEEIEYLLAEQPTVDAVEVVRCKDCKHWKDGVSGCTDYAKCCDIGWYMVGENGYCCYGEKKEQ